MPMLLRTELGIVYQTLPLCKRDSWNYAGSYAFLCVKAAALQCVCSEIKVTVKNFSAWQIIVFITVSNHSSLPTLPSALQV